VRINTGRIDGADPCVEAARRIDTGHVRVDTGCVDEGDACIDADIADIAADDGRRASRG